MPPLSGFIINFHGFNILADNAEKARKQWRGGASDDEVDEKCVCAGYVENAKECKQIEKQSTAKKTKKNKRN
jgi:hypothetical protein